MIDARLLLVCVLVGGVSGTGCALYGPGDATEFDAVLTGEAERPDPVETDGSGTGTFSLSEDESQLSYDIAASGLSGGVVGAHFHVSLTGASGFGEIVFDFTDMVVNDGAGGATAQGVWNLSAEDLRNLRIGYMYVNLHTELNPAGEIRGNLVPAG